MIVWYKYNEFVMRGCCEHYVIVFGFPNFYVSYYAMPRNIKWLYVCGCTIYDMLPETQYLSMMEITIFDRECETYMGMRNFLKK